MSMEDFPNPEKKSFFDKHKSVIETMKAAGLGIASGVIGGVILEIINQEFGLGMSPEFITSAAGSGCAIATVINLDKLKNKK